MLLRPQRCTKVNPYKTYVLFIQCTSVRECDENEGLPSLDRLYGQSETKVITNVQSNRLCIHNYRPISFSLCSSPSLPPTPHSSQTSPSPGDNRITILLKQLHNHDLSTQILGATDFFESGFWKIGS